MKKFTNDIRLKVLSYNTIQEKKEFLLDYMGETTNVQYAKLRNKISKVKFDAELDIIMFNMQLMSEGLGVK